MMVFDGEFYFLAALVAAASLWLAYECGRAAASRRDDVSQSSENDDVVGWLSDEDAWAQQAISQMGNTLQPRSRRVSAPVRGQFPDPQSKESGVRKRSLLEHLVRRESANLAGQLPRLCVQVNPERPEHADMYLQAHNGLQHVGEPVSCAMPQRRKPTRIPHLSLSIRDLPVDVPINGDRVHRTPLSSLSHVARGMTPRKESCGEAMGTTPRSGERKRSGPEHLTRESAHVTGQPTQTRSHVAPEPVSRSPSRPAQSLARRRSQSLQSSPLQVVTFDSKGLRVFPSSSSSSPKSRTCASRPQASTDISPRRRRLAEREGTHSDASRTDDGPRQHASASSGNSRQSMMQRRRRSITHSDLQTELLAAERHQWWSAASRPQASTDISPNSIAGSRIQRTSREREDTHSDASRTGEAPRRYTSASSGNSRQRRRSVSETDLLCLLLTAERHEASNHTCSVSAKYSHPRPAKNIAQPVSQQNLRGAERKRDESTRGDPARKTSVPAVRLQTSAFSTKIHSGARFLAAQVTRSLQQKKDAEEQKKLADVTHNAGLMAMLDLHAPRLLIKANSSSTKIQDSQPAHSVSMGSVSMRRVKNSSTGSEERPSPERQVQEVKFAEMLGPVTTL